MKSFLTSVFAVLFATVAMVGPAYADDPVATAAPTPVTTTPVANDGKFTAVSLDSELPGEGYFGFDVGSGFQNTDTNRRGDAAFYSATYGRNLGLYDVEVEGFRSSTSGKVKIGNVDVLGVMVNGRAKYLNTTKFTPFVQLGAGVGHFSDTGVKDDGMHFLLSGGAGVAYALSDDTNVELGYKRLWSPADVRGNNWKSDNFEQDVVTLGVNFKY